MSRAGTFAECKRRFYFEYYLAWRGWERDAPDERKQAYLLKKMTRMPMHAGTCLHDALQWWFEEKRAGRDAPPNEVVAHAVDALRRGWVESRDGSWRQRPAKKTRLAEHHFGEPEVDESTDAARDYGTRFVDRIRDGVETFFTSADLAPVRDAAPDTWLACEELGTIELFGEKVYAVPDFAFRTADGAAIYDWKTGKPREADRFQLALYALYAEQTWGLEPTSVRCVDAYLTTGEVVEDHPTREELDATLGRVEASIGAMRALHFDAGEMVGDREHFPMIPADSDDARACRRCNFREVCGRT